MSDMTNTSQQYHVIADRDKGDEPTPLLIEDGDRVTVVAYNAHEGYWEDGNEGIVRIERPVPTTDKQVYPFAEDATVVLGPGVFAAEDRSVLNWDGVNYVPQLAPHPPTREQIAEAWDQGFADGRRQDAEGEDGPRFTNPYRAALIQNGADR